VDGPATAKRLPPYVLSQCHGMCSKFHSAQHRRLAKRTIRCSVTDTTNTLSSYDQCSKHYHSQELKWNCTQITWTAWYRKTLCMASRMCSFPRNENEKFDTPPLTLQPGRVC